MADLKLIGVKLLAEDVPLHISNSNTHGNKSVQALGLVCWTLLFIGDNCADDESMCCSQEQEV